MTITCYRFSWKSNNPLWCRTPWRFKAFSIQYSRHLQQFSAPVTWVNILRNTEIATRVHVSQSKTLTRGTRVYQLPWNVWLQSPLIFYITTDLSKFFRYRCNYIMTVQLSSMFPVGQKIDIWWSLKFKKLDLI